MENQQLQRLSTEESNKLLKKALQDAFPGTKFSCRMDRGTSYGSVSIQWEDGPIPTELDPILRQFESQGFDGMTDSTTHKPTCIYSGGQAYRSGIRMISTSRRISDARRGILETGILRLFPQVGEGTLMTAVHRLSWIFRGGSLTTEQILEACDGLAMGPRVAERIERA